MIPATDAAAAKSLEDYRHFRALSIDLVGRMPTRAEIAAFEVEGFDLDGWVDQQLAKPAAAERLRRVYVDLLRLEVGPAFQFVPANTTLRFNTITGPDGSTIKVAYRIGQRRARPETDGEFCFTQAETGQQFPRLAAPTGAPTPVSQAVIDSATVQVKPWWLYRDYASAAPADRYGSGWEKKAGFQLVDPLTKAADGTEIEAIRACKEEAQSDATGAIFATGRLAPKAGTPPPFGRLTQLPLDSTLAKTHAGEPIACTAGTALANSAACGCGKGLERCMPTQSFAFESTAFTFATQAPLGADAPFDSVQQGQSAWERYWWNQEAKHFLDTIFSEDRDFREVLTAKWTVVNGPLTQFYRSVAPSTCCGNGTNFNLVEPEPLFDPKALPSLLPHDAATWAKVADRGDKASGILTMPVFLTKYGSRRARAHVLYNAFLCRDFIAENVQLTPSTEPNLMVRPGCSTCHQKLEPLSAYFSRVVESDWTYLPSDKFPQESAFCAQSATTGKINGVCTNYYDPAFTTKDKALLRGSYGSPANVEAGPAGAAAEILKSPEFAGCVAENVAASFLGRPLGPDDTPLKAELADAFVGGGYHMRALVRALVRADAYKRANNLSSTTWRNAR